MFRAIALACVFSASVPAWACQTLLRSPLLKISSNYTLSRQAENALRRMDISHAAFHRLAESQQSFVLGESSRFWTIIFRTDRRHLDEGILVTGWRNGKQFNIEEAFRSRPRDESDYFKEVARRHGMQTKVVQLKKNILNCQ